MYLERMGAQRFAFGTFVLDIERGMLVDRGMPVSVGSKGFAILRTLIEAQGSIVTKTALLDAVWPGTAIEESNLSVQMAQLRKRIGVSPSGEEWIATVPRVGYRFTGVVQIADGNAFEGTHERPAAASAAAIAVLPFNNLSSDPEQEYFAQGLSEDLITDLSRVPGLVVVARNSSFAYKGRSIDIRQVARELGVRYVIEGSVRRAQSRVRINAEIIDAVEHKHVWADRFDRDLSDIFALQDEVVAKIVGALAPALRVSQPVFSQRAKNLEAYDLFVRGRVLSVLSADGNRAARPLLERSVAIEPDFVDALAWLAMTYHFGWLYWQEPEEPNRSIGRATAARAVALDPNNADARWIFGYVKAYDNDLKGGMEQFAAALTINPNHADAWVLLSDLKVFLGAPAEAVECVRNAFRLNPYRRRFTTGRMVGHCTQRAAMMMPLKHSGMIPPAAPARSESSLQAWPSLGG